MALKSNHPTLHSQVKNWFDAAVANNFEGITVSHDRRVEKAHRLRVNGLLSVKTEQEGHHRREKRRVWAVPLSEFAGLYQQEQWLGLQSIVMVERTRHLWNKVTYEVQFYLSSLPADAHVLGNAIRTHWGIEKRCPHSGINDPAEVSSARERAPRDQVHWTLDVTFNEDKSRIRSGHAPRNFAFLRRMALNALNLEKTLKRSLRQKSRRTSMNNDYMMTVLKCFCQ